MRYDLFLIPYISVSKHTEGISILTFYQIFIRSWSRDILPGSAVTSMKESHRYSRECFLSLQVNIIRLNCIVSNFKCSSISEFEFYGAEIYKMILVKAEDFVFLYLLMISTLKLTAFHLLFQKSLSADPQRDRVSRAPVSVSVLWESSLRSVIMSYSSYCGTSSTASRYSRARQRAAEASSSLVTARDNSRSVSRARARSEFHRDSPAASPCLPGRGYGVPDYRSTSVDIRTVSPCRGAGGYYPR